jgi:hypothetical protein
MKRATIKVITAVLPLSIAGCSSKSDPSEKNFTPLISQLFTQNNLACLPRGSYPTKVPEASSEKDDPMGFEARKFLDSLANAGVLNRHQFRPGEPSCFRARRCVTN